MRRLLPILGLAALAATCAAPVAPGLAIGAAIPDFALPGADGRTHTLSEFGASPVLAIAFICNRCPESQLYEARLKTLHERFRARGVSLVAINPNSAAGVTLADLAYTDVGESLEDMKARATAQAFGFPYLSDGETQAVTRQFGVTVTPQIFVFDRARTLRYRGRIDDNLREDRIRSHYAANAIEALLAERAVGRTTISATGCAVKGPPAASGGDHVLAKFKEAPVALEMVGADDLKSLRRNPTGKVLMINFWATWCAPCIAEFPDLETTYRMYKERGFEFVTVSVNDPEERPGVLEFLRAQHAAHPNRQFATADLYGLQAAFDPKMPAPVPFTVVLARNGEVVHQELGASDILTLRRVILASLPDHPRYPSQRAYWTTLAETASRHTDSRSRK
jgi:peroxiredoxin